MPHATSSFLYSLSTPILVPWQLLICFHLYNFVTLRMSYEENHIACHLLRMAFSFFFFLKIHPGCDNAIPFTPSLFWHMLALLLNVHLLRPSSRVCLSSHFGVSSGSSLCVLVTLVFTSTLITLYWCEAPGPLSSPLDF